MQTRERPASLDGGGALPVMLNIGCGSVHHQDWINLDLEPKSPDVVRHDLRGGLPFGSGSVDACYSSHVLEHLRRDEAEVFVREQKRVLKRGGVIRVVVPDLETICRNYISNLEAALAGRAEAEFRYDYSLLELFDQTVRDRSGGELAKLWSSANLSDQAVEFILQRHGLDAVHMIPGRSAGSAERGAPLRSSKRFQWLSKKLERARYRMALSLLGGLAGRRGVEAFREGWFRTSGEVHRVMYDRFNLGRLLGSLDFAEIGVFGPGQSRIADFASYGLEVEGGRQRKPDSLYMEAVRR
jgi:SAM-dependent methyltransferase